MEGAVLEYKTEKAIVRIHPGKLSEEERKVVMTNAAKEFYKAIQKSNNTQSA
jgi:hypothetical protein